MIVAINQNELNTQISVKSYLNKLRKYKNKHLNMHTIMYSTYNIRIKLYNYVNNKIPIGFAYTVSLHLQYNLQD